MKSQAQIEAKKKMIRNLSAPVLRAMHFENKVIYDHPRVCYLSVRGDISESDDVKVTIFNSLLAYGFIERSGNTKYFGIREFSEYRLTAHGNAVADFLGASE